MSIFANFTVTPSTPETLDFEQVGYTLLSDLPNPITQDGNTITNLSIKLVNIDNNNPSKKYKYNVTFDYDFDYQIDNKHMFVAFDNTSEQKMIATYGGCSDQLTGTFEKKFLFKYPIR